MVKYILNKYADRGEQGRLAVGRIAGIVGISVNVILFLLKISVGFATDSVSVVADAVNNLSDAMSSVIVVVGYILCARPADREHPFGHARMEYLCGLFISVIITVLGIELFKSSAEKFFAPAQDSAFSVISVVIMVCAIAAKVFLALFYRAVGKGINSTALKASATDSIGDVIATSAVIAGLFLTPVFGPAADALIGCALAVYIVVLGIKLILESSGTLLGEAPDSALVANIADKISSYDGVLGIHDLVIHSYGSGALYATVHVEVDSDGDMILTHDLIDNIEADFLNDMGLHLVIHMDPVCTSDEDTNNARTRIAELIGGIAEKCSCRLSMHDFRMVKGVTHSNLIFDVAVPRECPLSDRELSEMIADGAKRIDPLYNCVITVDREYDSFRFGKEED